MLLNVRLADKPSLPSNITITSLVVMFSNDLGNMIGNAPVRMEFGREGRKKEGGRKKRRAVIIKKILLILLSPMSTPLTENAALVMS